MREIKFRAWNGTEMIDDYIATSNRYGDVIVTQRSTACKVLMQYTCLKDKNGKEIYEGDIIKYRITFGKSRDIIREMKWKEEFNGFGPMEYKCEVIGNIYENPEIL